MRRIVVLLPVLIALQAGVPPALAWTWPVSGPVLRPFNLGDDPYAGGQHRGVDLAATLGAPVRAPAAGTVSFAGSVPGGGLTVTVRTPDGYSVTLLHLGAVGVSLGATVAEGQPLGEAGASGAAEHERPYVHLGVRHTDDPHGYVDPLGLLPTPEEAPPPPAPVEEPVPRAPAPAVQQPAPPPAPVAERPDPEAAEDGATATGTTARTGAAAVAVAEPAPPAHREAAVEEEAGVPKHVRTSLGSFERARPAPSELPGAASAEREPVGATVGGAGFRTRPAALAGAVALLALGLVGVACAVALQRRDFARARLADAAPAVLGDRARRPAEHARGPGAAEEDRLILDRDLERIALGQSEALPDLDGDDDPPELVQVPDDPCRRLRPAVAYRRFHRVGSRPLSGCGSTRPLSVR
ncbi:MAG TPA: M23 family metallopeptidase [Gaiellaceae bacterium]|nr:M23 family metallopeptidase [Gaiellaceae bacterium]